MGIIAEQTRKKTLETQQNVLAALKNHQHNERMDREIAGLLTGKPSSDQILEIINQCADISKLGNVGNVVKNFAESVYLQHPDISEITSRDEWPAFSRDVSQVLAGANPDKLSSYKSIIRQMFSPRPRLVRDGILRDDLRQQKKQIKHIGLKQAYMTGDNGFYSKPVNFDIFIRNSDIQSEELSNLKKQRQAFSSRGLSELAHSVVKRIADYEESASSSYLGFRRLTPTDAAIISARMLDLPWHDLYFVIIPFDFFQTPYWNAERKSETSKTIDEMKRLMVMRDRKTAMADSIAFSYQPRFYPLAKFDKMPKHISQVIEILESFPELNGCPVFDYYWVVMPSININHPFIRKKDEWSVYVKPDEQHPWNKPYIKTFKDEFEAAFALDKSLVDDGYFVPVLLGERDGKCYFLTLWN